MEIDRTKGKASFEFELVKLETPIFCLKKGLAFTVENKNRSWFGVLSGVTCFELLLRKMGMGAKKRQVKPL